MQSRRDSMLEVATNTAVGFVGSWIITWLSFKYVSQTGLAATISVTGCTVWSLARGLCHPQALRKENVEEREMKINWHKVVVRLTALNLLALAVSAWMADNLWLALTLGFTIAILELHLQMLGAVFRHLRALSLRIAKLQSIAEWPEPYHPDPKEGKKHE